MQFASFLLQNSVRSQRMRLSRTIQGEAPLFVRFWSTCAPFEILNRSRFLLVLAVVGLNAAIRIGTYMGRMRACSFIHFELTGGDLRPLKGGP